jgi:DNA-binding HxlR family transcriptional regulator
MKIENPDLESFLKCCPIRSVLDRLGDRWTILVLVELQKGTRRFSVLRREIPDISPRMLSLTVRRLEEDGMVSRVVFPTIPPKVEYSVTPLGLSFVRSLNVLVQWAAENREEVLAARMAYVPPTAEPAK